MYGKDVIITYETHKNDVVSIDLECDNTCF